jgi:hypothetical protein
MELVVAVCNPNVKPALSFSRMNAGTNAPSGENVTIGW